MILYANSSQTFDFNQNNAPSFPAANKSFNHLKDLTLPSTSHCLAKVVFLSYNPLHLLAYPCDNYTRVLICTKEDFREFCNPGMGNTIVLTKAISHFGHLYLLHYNFPFGIQMVLIFFSVRDPKTKKHRNLPETNM